MSQTFVNAEALDELQVIDGERGMPSLNESGSRIRSTAVKGVAYVSLGLLLFAGMGAAYWKYRYASAAEDVSSGQKEISLQRAVPARTFELIAEPKPKASPPPLPVLKAAVPAPVVPKPTSERESPPKPKAARAEATPRPDKSRYTMMATGGAAAQGEAGIAHSALDNTADSSLSDQPDSGQSSTPIKVIPASSQGEPMGLLSGSGSLDTVAEEFAPAALTPSFGANDSIAARLQGSSTKTAIAHRLQNSDLLLTKGSFIDCVLQTKLISQLPGMTSCVVTRDIWSTTGKVLLIERGSVVTGEYRSNLQQGMNRIFVLWDRIKTPSGVVADLSSPGTDSLGASGVEGNVDTHFWKRFGGALLLSLVEDAIRIATVKAAETNADITLNGAGTAASSLAAEVLRNTINIPPTLYTNQGARIGIFVARDLDFSGVYRVDRE